MEFQTKMENFKIMQVVLVLFLSTEVSNKNGNSQQKPDPMLEYKTGYAHDEMYQFARIIAR